MTPQAYLNSYFRLQVSLSFRPSVRGCVGHTLGLKVISQNVTNKSSLVYVESEKYAFWATLRHLRSMWQGKAELLTLNY